MKSDGKTTQVIEEENKTVRVGYFPYSNFQEGSYGEHKQGEYSWKMMKVSDVKASAEEVSSLGYNTSDWLSAIVPGTVLNSLVYNKKYPEPSYGLNNKIESNKIPDISKVGREFYTYWFRTEFEVPASFSGKNIWLQPDGINYRAEVWVNGNLLSTINGMFVNDYINITDFVKVGNKNVLAVKVYPVDVPGTTMPKSWGAVMGWQANFRHYFDQS